MANTECVQVALPGPPSSGNASSADGRISGSGLKGPMKPVIILLLAVLLPHAARAADLVEGTAFVIDGDTIEINEVRIRLWGMDAPESAQRCTEDGLLYPCGLDASHARAAKVGVWAGELQDPSEFRHQPRRATSRAEHHGCTCPDDTDRAGRRCGRRSAYLRSGGAKSTCVAR